LVLQRVENILGSPRDRDPAGRTSRDFLASLHGKSPSKPDHAESRPQPIRESAVIKWRKHQGNPVAKRKRQFWGKKAWRKKFK
jgi:hypothetical protein